jgi:arylformamidase
MISFSEILDLSHEWYDGMPNIGRNPVSFGTLYDRQGMEELTQGKLSMEGRLIVMPEHCGTHFDSPFHFDPDGMDVAQYPLDRLVLPGHLLDLTATRKREPITIADLERAQEASGREIGSGTALLAWTGADRDWGQPGFERERAFVPVETARWLVERGISLFGTDLIGMDDPDEWWWPTHAEWLRGGVPMVQQLCGLERLVGKEFFFVVLPLKMRGGTGSPVRAAAFVA